MISVLLASAFAGEPVPRQPDRGQPLVRAPLPPSVFDMERFEIRGSSGRPLTTLEVLDATWRFDHLAHYDETLRIKQRLARGFIGTGAVIALGGVGQIAWTLAHDYPAEDIVVGLLLVEVGAITGALSIFPLQGCARQTRPDHFFDAATADELLREHEAALTRGKP